ncbi:hypothetical protein [Variovorax sp. YR216]|uniref:hypothetical protein n=1 Tax=Variovorax sp. YR216 TaxID=1882828 RepID=UPI00115FA3CC|nr:hypothetical protein [Variovorax sp. YR216]
MSILGVCSGSEIDDRHSSLFLGKDDPNVGLLSHPTATSHLSVPRGQEANPTRRGALAESVGQLQKAKRASIRNEEDIGREVAAGNASTADENRQSWPRRNAAGLEVCTWEQEQPRQGIEIEHDSGPKMQKGNESNSLPLRGRLAK